MIRLPAMSNDKFSNLMGQFSSEEIARREQEDRIRRRRELLHKLFRKFLVLIVVGVFAAGIYYRVPIQAGIEKVTGHSASQKQEDGPEHSPLIKQIQEAAKKRDKILDDTMK